MIDDGTSWDGLPLHAALRDRQRYGHGYRNELLEEKRRSAIKWLRESSTIGWACDQVTEDSKCSAS